MDQEDNMQNQLLGRYLQDKLSDQEQALFEERFLASEQLLNELEAVERLKQGLQDIAALDRAHARNQHRSWFVSVFQSPKYAMAASFFLLVSLGVSSALFQQLGQPRGFDPVAGSLPTQITPLVSVRGTSGDEPVNTLQLGNTDQQFVLMLDPGFTVHSHYRTTVYRQDASGTHTRIWQADNMLPGYEDMLALFLPSQLLDPGDFEIQIEGWKDEWPENHALDPVDTLTFRVLASP